MHYFLLGIRFLSGEIEIFANPYDGFAQLGIICVYFIPLLNWLVVNIKRPEKLWNTGRRNLMTKTLLPEQLRSLLDIINYPWVLAYTKTSISGTSCCLFVSFIFKSFEHWDGSSHCSHTICLVGLVNTDICFPISEDRFGFFSVVKSIQIRK